MQNTFIPLSVPNFAGNEKEYVNKAIISEWVSTGGSFVSDFEDKLAQYVHMPRAVACNSGTSGLHLACLVSGIGTNDEVIVPALTFIAAVNPVRYCGAEPVFIGCDDSLCISCEGVEGFCRDRCEIRAGKLYNKSSGKCVKAIMVVHVFSNMANMPELMRIARKYHLTLIEDATEALGSYYTDGIYSGKMAGTIGDIGVYSFNGNKIITTGSGGMLVSNNDEYASHAKHLSTQSKADELQFLHDEVGYNYRLSNLQAALGLAQLEQLETFIEHKIARYEQYRLALDGKNGYKLLPFAANTRCNHWFYSLLIPDASKRDEYITKLHEQKIQTRPIWALINEQADYARNEAYYMDKALYYRAHILNLPCSTNLSEADAERVIDAVLHL